MKPIRILHCVVNMNRGGAETLIMNIYRNIERSKVQFDFLTSHEGVFEEEIKELGGRVYRIPYITQCGPFAYSKNVYNFFKEHSEYKIVHSHMDRMSGVIMREAKRAGVPIRIAHSHSTQSNGNIFIKVIKSYYSYWLKDATNYFACSKSAARFIFLNRRVEFINNGIDIKKFVFNREIRDVVRKKYRIENKLVIGHVGRFDKPKNQDFLIDIFKAVHEKDKSTILMLIGTGELESHIRKKVKQYGLSDDVIFMGSRANVNELIQAFDMFVFPSIFEGLPVTVIEAQGAGLKCVVSDSITKEVDVTGNVEFVSLYESAEYWAELVLENSRYERKDTAEQIRESGYDIAYTAKKLEDIYLEKWK